MTKGVKLSVKTASRLADVLRAMNYGLRKADEGVFGVETRVALLEDNVREIVCALLGATNPVVLEDPAALQPQPSDQKGSRE